MQNDGSIADVQDQRNKELRKFPYTWFGNDAYHQRGKVTGRLRLSDGRPASGAAIFLGDRNTSIRPLVQGSNYYYTTYASEDGNFSFPDVRTGSYGLYAWSNGGVLADVYTNFTTANVTVTNGRNTNLRELAWKVPSGRSRIFQIGDFDKKALGFKNGGLPYQHGATEQSPASLTYTIGKSTTSDWYYAQSAIGTWTVEFTLSPEEVENHRNSSALLSVSLAGYSQSTALDINVNGQIIRTLSKDVLASDPALYRSGKTSGEWRFLQYDIDAELLHSGVNRVGFTVTRYTKWRGFLWDSVILEW